MPTSLVQQHAPRISRGVYSGVAVVVNAVETQRQFSSCSVFSVQAVELQLLLTSGEFRVDLTGSASGFHAHFTCATVRSSQFLLASLRYHCGTSQGHRGSCWTFSTTQAVLSQLLFHCGGHCVELSRVARRPLVRMVLWLGWWQDWGCPCSTSRTRKSSSHRVSGCQWISCPFLRDTVRSSYFSGVIWGVTEVVSAVKHQGQYG